jgi:hypothetical protein
MCLKFITLQFPILQYKNKIDIIILIKTMSNINSTVFVLLLILSSMTCINIRKKATNAHFWTPSCSHCTTVCNFLEKQIVNKGIKTITDAIGGTACELIGLGPEDPFADLCVVAFVAVSSKIIDAVVDEHLHDGKAICKKIHYC